MEKLVLMDYLGTCNEENIPIGHTVKVLNEYSDMLSQDYEVWVATAKSTQDKVQNPNKIYAPFAICLGIRGKVGKLKNIYRRLKNISAIFRQSGKSPVWICSTDFYIFLYLYLCLRKKNKLAITLYRRNFDGEKLKKVKNYVFRHAIKKVDLIICFDKEIKNEKIPVFYMPDYLYEPKQYEGYQTEKKTDKVVCLGTMGVNKLLDELVDAFKQNGYSLEIVGNFLDKDIFNRLKEKAGANIKICNQYISDDEYLSLLASAKYSILPYNMQMYQARTSGVILESVFLNTIPIAHEELLGFMGIPGVSYRNIEELASMDLQYLDKEYNYRELIAEE